VSDCSAVFVVVPKLKIKLSLCLIKQCAIKTCAGVQVKQHLDLELQVPMATLDGMIELPVQ
jgi:hypothetical protein